MVLLDKRVFTMGRDGRVGVGRRDLLGDGGLLEGLDGPPAGYLELGGFPLYRGAGGPGAAAEVGRELGVGLELRRVLGNELVQAQLEIALSEVIEAIGREETVSACALW